MTIKEAFRRLSSDQRREATISISSKCKVALSTVNNWKYGVCKPAPLYRDIIKEIFNDYNIDLN